MTDALDDARVLASLSRILNDGAPYTAIPGIDPTTYLPPAPTVAALRVGLVRFLDENGDPLVGKFVTITVNSSTGEIDDITSEDI